MNSSQCSLESISSRVSEPQSIPSIDIKGKESVSYLCSQLGRMDKMQTQRLLKLEEENISLKKQLDDCILEIQALQDVLKNAW